MGNLLANYEEAAAIILFGIGFTTLLLHRNLIKKVIGFSMMDSAIYLFLAAKGSAYRAISLGASLGGDTDTIAALAGALTAAQAGHADIPDHIARPVRAVNGPILRRLGL